MDRAQQRLVERRLVAALRRLHRREPMRADFRADVVLRELRADAGERLPAGHRGGGSVRHLRDTELLDVVDQLVASGKLVRGGRNLSLPEHEPALLGPEMLDRVGRLMTELQRAGAEPPRVAGIAARLGIPRGVVDQLRTAGELVQVGEGIDYPRTALGDLRARLDTMARDAPLSVARVRDELRTSRRHAEALIGYHGTRVRLRKPASSRPDG